MRQISFRRNGRRRKAIVSAVGALTVGSILPWNALGSTTPGPLRIPNDAAYTSWANQSAYASVGAVSFYASSLSQTFLSSGVLISPEWVLTAGHVATPPETQTFNIGGTNWQNGTSVLDNQHFANPGWTGDISSGMDIGLIHLSTPITTIAPASRYFGSSELNQIGTSIGFRTHRRWQHQASGERHWNASRQESNARFRTSSTDRAPISTSFSHREPMSVPMSWVLISTMEPTRQTSLEPTTPATTLPWLSKEPPLPATAEAACSLMSTVGIMSPASRRLF